MTETQRPATAPEIGEAALDTQKRIGDFRICHAPVGRHQQIGHIEPGASYTGVDRETGHPAITDIAIGRLQVIFRRRHIDTLDAIEVLVIEQSGIDYPDVIRQPVLAAKRIGPQPFLAQIFVAEQGFRIVVLAIG